MIDFNLILENERLDKAVDAFAAQMKKVLHEKAKAGKRGWDGNVPQDEYIAEQLFQDANSLNVNIAYLPFENDVDGMMVIDIANRAMILWARHNSITVTTNVEGNKNNG